MNGAQVVDVLEVGVCALILCQKLPARVHIALEPVAGTIHLGHRIAVHAKQTLTDQLAANKLGYAKPDGSSYQGGPVRLTSRMAFYGGFFGCATAVNTCGRLGATGRDISDHRRYS
ncbi:MAG: hypothetical protein WCD57_09530 [Acidobacteriaceae bacterium]